MIQIGTVTFAAEKSETTRTPEMRTEKIGVSRAEANENSSNAASEISRSDYELRFLPFSNDRTVQPVRSKQHKGTGGKRD